MHFFGAKKLLGLEYLIHSRYSGAELLNELTVLGYDPEKVLNTGKSTKLYPENNNVNETEALRDFIVKESLSYGLPSSETALIAVYHKAGKRVEATALVPNALPEGWSEDFLSGAPMAPACPAPMARKAFKQKLSAATIINDIRDGSGGEQFRIARSGPAKGGSAPDGTIFKGAARFAGKEAVLFDSAANATVFHDSLASRISQLIVSFPGGAPEAVDKNVSILIFIGDMVVPRATVKLADLLRMGGIRPLNITVNPGDHVKIVLSDPAGAWDKSVPDMEVSLKVN